MNIALQPVIKTLAPKLLVGKHVRMNLANNRTFELFSNFMPRRKETSHRVNELTYCLQAYDASLDFKVFNLQTWHEKWAAVEVLEATDIPEGMEILKLEGGLYAVFLYKGDPREFAETFRYIFFEWMPASVYEPDQRPHFEVLGERYKNNSPDSEEEVWIPVRKKS